MKPEPPKCPDAAICQRCGLSDTPYACTPEERVWEEREEYLRTRREWLERER